METIRTTYRPTELRGLMYKAGDIDGRSAWTNGYLLELAAPPLMVARVASRISGGATDKVLTSRMYDRVTAHARANAIHPLTPLRTREDAHPPVVEFSGLTAPIYFNSGFVAYLTKRYPSARWLGTAPDCAARLVDADGHDIAFVMPQRI